MDWNHEIAKQQKNERFFRWLVLSIENCLGCTLENYKIPAEAITILTKRQPSDFDLELYHGKPQRPTEFPAVSAKPCYHA